MNSAADKYLFSIILLLRVDLFIYFNPIWLTEVSWDNCGTIGPELLKGI